MPWLDLTDSQTPQLYEQNIPVRRSLSSSGSAKDDSLGNAMTEAASGRCALERPSSVVGSSYREMRQACQGRLQVASGYGGLTMVQKQRSAKSHNMVSTPDSPRRPFPAQPPPPPPPSNGFRVWPQAPTQPLKHPKAKPPYNTPQPHHRGEEVKQS